MYLRTQRSWIGNNMRVVRECTCPRSSPEDGGQERAVPAVDLPIQKLWHHVRISQSLNLSKSLSLGLRLSLVLSLIIQKLNIHLKIR
jgi:hypothetical protein